VVRSHQGVLLAEGQHLQQQVTAFRMKIHDALDLVGVLLEKPVLEVL
jgi:hypothetical protein